VVDSPARGEIYWTRFDPSEGAEIGKTRPAVVVQNDTGNRFSSTTIVAAVSSRYADRRYPFLVPVPDGILPRPSVVNCAQLRTVDTSRLSDTRIGLLDSETMKCVDSALRLSLGLE
jgi:mRNA interferase MazF